MRLQRNLGTGIIYSLILLLLLNLLAGCAANRGGTAAKAGAASEKSDGEVAVKLNIADISTNPVFRVAVHQGFLEKYGIKAELVNFATPAEGINSLFIKQADIGWGADYPILNAVSKGEYTIIASTGTSTDKNAAQWKLFVRDEIQQPEQLKGKALSFLRGTFISYLWDEYLAEHGIEIKETKLVGQGGSDESYIALKKGEVDAVWVSGAAMTQKFSELEGVHQLTDMSQTGVRIGSQIIVPNSLIIQHQDKVKGFLLALDESSRYIKEHPDEVADLLYKEVKQPKESTLKDLSVTNWEVNFTQQAYESLERQKKYMVENSIIQQDFNLTDKIDLQFLREALPDREAYTP